MTTPCNHNPIRGGTRSPPRSPRAAPRVRRADGTACPSQCVEWYKKGFSDAERFSRANVRSHVKGSENYWKRKLEEQKSKDLQKLMVMEAEKNKAQALVTVLQTNLDDVLDNVDNVDDPYDDNAPSENLMDFYNFDPDDRDFDPDAEQESIPYEELEEMMRRREDN